MSLRECIGKLEHKPTAHTRFMVKCMGNGKRKIKCICRCTYIDMQPICSYKVLLTETRPLYAAVVYNIHTHIRYKIVSIKKISDIKPSLNINVLGVYTISFYPWRSRTTYILTVILLLTMLKRIKFAIFPRRNGRIAIVDLTAKLVACRRIYSMRYGGK